MWTRSKHRVLAAPVYLVAGIIALAGCGTGSPPPLPGDPTPTARSMTSPPAQSQEQSTTVTPMPPEPTTAPSSAPVADSWARLDDMSVPRERFAALELLDGRVFVIEESDVISDLAGPPADPGPTDILDPATRRWTPADPLNAPRSGYVAARLRDGRVLVTGGNNGWYGAYSSTKLFDPATGRWTSTGLLNSARIGPAGALLADGRVLVAGGTYAEGYKGQDDFDAGRGSSNERELTLAELYDPKSGRWSRTGSLHDAGSAGIAYMLPDGRVLAVGEGGRGLQGDDSHRDPAEIYDPMAGTWAVVGKVNWLNASVPVLLADGSLLLIGGAAGEDKDRAVATVRRFGPGSGATSPVAPLPAPRMSAVAARLADGRVLVAGGLERLRLESGHLAPPTATAFLYDPALDRWTETAPMPFANSPGKALLLSDGSVLVMGGSVPDPSTEMDTDGSYYQPVGWTARFVPGIATGN